MTNPQATVPPSTGPPLIDLNTVRLIHRAPDSFTAFGTKRQSSWQDLFSLSADALQTLPTEALQLLGTDAYFSLNGLYRAGHGISRAVPSLPRAFRRTDGLRYLNVAYTDLDIHKAGDDAPRIVEDRLAEVATSVKAGTLPLPSLIVRSGRGAWLLWLLSGAATRLPPRSTADNLMLYRAIQSAIQRRLAPLGADPLAVDAVRMARVPGSVHSGTGSRVSYELQAGPAGKPPSYTLEALAAAFGVSLAAPPKPHMEPRAFTCRSLPRVDKATQGKKPSGWANVNRSRLRQLDQLQEIRGGFSEGCRNFAALLLATTLHGLGGGIAAISERVSQLAASCKPPLPDSECKAAIKSGMSGRYRFRNATISNGLTISPAEAEQLETWGPAGASHAPASSPKAVGTKSGGKKDRHRLILSIVEQGWGVLPSVRKMVKLFKDHGHTVGRSTVQRDFKELGLVMSHGGDALPSSTPLVPSQAPEAAA